MRGTEKDRVSICQVDWAIDRGMMAEGGMNGEREGRRGVIDLRGQARRTLSKGEWCDLEWLEILLRSKHNQTLSIWGCFRTFVWQHVCVCSCYGAGDFYWKLQTENCFAFVLLRKHTGVWKDGKNYTYNKYHFVIYLLIKYKWVFNIIIRRCGHFFSP